MHGWRAQLDVISALSRVMKLQIATTLESHQGKTGLPEDKLTVSPLAFSPLVLMTRVNARSITFDTVENKAVSSYRSEKFDRGLD